MRRSQSRNTRVMGKCPIYSCGALVNDGGGARGGVGAGASGVIGALSFAACASDRVEVEAGAVEIGGEEVAA